MERKKRLELLDLNEVLRSGSIVVMFITLLVCASFVPQKTIQSTSEEPQIVAFQRKPPEVTTPELLKCLESKSARPYEHQLLKKYGIVVLAMEHGRDTSPIALLELCSEPKAEWLEVPVIHDHGTYQVPTNEIIITVKNEPSTLLIERLRQKYALVIVQPPTHRDPNRFTVSLDGPLAAKSVSVAAEIAKSPEVEYAEVNFVVIAFPLVSKKLSIEG